MSTVSEKLRPSIFPYKNTDAILGLVLLCDFRLSSCPEKKSILSGSVIWCGAPKCTVLGHVPSKSAISSWSCDPRGIVDPEDGIPVWGPLCIGGYGVGDSVVEHVLCMQKVLGSIASISRYGRERVLSEILEIRCKRRQCLARLSNGLIRQSPMFL